ncbi:unnamed protein product [Diamesa serratosioi]
MSTIFNVCRICLNPNDNENYESIFDNNGQKANEIFLIAGLQIEEEYALLCESCSIELERAVNLRRLIVEANQYLQELKLDYDETEIEVADNLTEHNPDEFVLSCKEEPPEEKPFIENVKPERTIIRRDSIMLPRKRIELEDLLKKSIDMKKRPVKSKKVKDEMEFACMLCEKEFREKQYLRQHLKLVHLRTEDSLCNICEKVFSSRRNLISHIKAVHEKIREYFCNSCTKSFTQKHRLVSHTTKFHGSLQVSCTFCSKLMTTSELKSHISEMHKVDEKFNCDSCHMSFKSLQRAKRHLQNCTKNQSTDAFSEETESDIKAEPSEENVAFKNSKLRK